MGLRLRELRVASGLQQSEVARRLEISPPYLSLIETGKRSVQPPLLFKALQLYGISTEEFMESLGERHVDDGLARLLDEPLLRSLKLSEDDLTSLSADSRIVTTITALFNLYKTTRSQLDNLLASIARQERDAATSADELRFDHSPFDEVTDFLEANKNWFPALEERADAFRQAHGVEPDLGSRGLAEVLLRAMGIEVRRVEPDGESSVVRSWDPDAGVVTLSTQLPEQRAKFQLAHTMALQLFEDERLIEPILDGYPLRHGETKRLLRINLANYFAGALLLPYDRFLQAAERTRYDVELLASLFDSSYETVAHRLCNLSDPERPGLPFHFLRVDSAGNISKRYSATGVRIPQHHGACPKSVVHLAFLSPNVVTRQYEVYPDGSEFFGFAKVVIEPKQGSIARGTVYAIGLGTHAENARFLAYADDMPFADPRRMAVPVGVTCRFCERTDCNQRAAPSYKFAFRVEENRKKDNFFSPIVAADEDTEVAAASHHRTRR